MADEPQKDVAPITQGATDQTVTPPSQPASFEPPVAPAQTPAPAPTVQAPATAEATPAEVATAPAPVPAPAAEAPVVVKENEVKTPNNEEERLGEEVEILTGEIQALEAKIEQLSGNVENSGNDEAAKPVADLPEPLPAAPKIEEKKDDAAQADEMPAKQPEEDLSAAALPPMSSEGPQDEKKETDMVMEKPAMMPTDSQPLNGPDVEEPVSVLGTIGEVFGVIGIILLVVMILSPFYKDLIGQDMFDTIKSIGWLTTVVALALGFLLSLFSRGKGALKFGLFFFLLIAVIIYVGIGNSSLADTLNGFLGPLIGYYR